MSPIFLFLSSRLQPNGAIDPRTSKETFSLAAGGAELRWSRTAYLLDTPLLDRLVQLARRGVIMSL